DRAVAFLARHLKPAKAEARRLFADLEHEDFPTRQRARKVLSGLGAEWLPVAYAALADGPSLELRLRLEGWLEGTSSQQFSPEARRALRAVWVLERIGTPAARAVLLGLQRGAGNLDLTRESAAALRRLAAGR